MSRDNSNDSEESFSVYAYKGTADFLLVPPDQQEILDNLLGKSNKISTLHVPHQNVQCEIDKDSEKNVSQETFAQNNNIPPAPSLEATFQNAREEGGRICSQRHGALEAVQSDGNGNMRHLNDNHTCTIVYDNNIKSSNPRIFLNPREKNTLVPNDPDLATSQENSESSASQVINNIQVLQNFFGCTSSLMQENRDLISQHSRSPKNTPVKTALHKSLSYMAVLSDALNTAAPKAHMDTDTNTFNGPKLNKDANKVSSNFMGKTSRNVVKEAYTADLQGASHTRTATANMILSVLATEQNAPILTLPDRQEVLDDLPGRNSKSSRKLSTVHIPYENVQCELAGKSLGKNISHGTFAENNVVSPAPSWEALFQKAKDIVEKLKGYKHYHLKKCISVPNLKIRSDNMNSSFATDDCDPFEICVPLLCDDINIRRCRSLPNFQHEKEKECQNNGLNALNKFCFALSKTREKLCRIQDRLDNIKMRRKRNRTSYSPSNASTASDEEILKRAKIHSMRLKKPDCQLTTNIKCYNASEERVIVCNKLYGASETVQSDIVSLNVPNNTVVPNAYMDVDTSTCDMPNINKRICNKLYDAPKTVQSNIAPLDVSSNNAVVQNAFIDTGTSSFNVPNTNKDVLNASSNLIEALSNAMNRTYTIQQQSQHQISDSEIPINTEPFSYVIGEETQRACIGMDSNEFISSASPPCTQINKTKSNVSPMSMSSTSLSPVKISPIIIRIESPSTKRLNIVNTPDNVLHNSNELFNSQNENLLGMADVPAVEPVQPKTPSSARRKLNFLEVPNTSTACLGQGDVAISSGYCPLKSKSQELRQRSSSDSNSEIVHVPPETADMEIEVETDFNFSPSQIAQMIGFINSYYLSQ